MKNSNNFSILSLEIRNNSIINSSEVLKFVFRSEAHDYQPELFTSVIIGPNGTRKSILLRYLIELFKEIHDISQNKSKTYYINGQYRLSYILNGDHYIYTNINKIGTLTILYPDSKYQSTLFKNGEQVDISSEALPDKIIAHSILPHDKFPIYKEGTFNTYKYLGIKGSFQRAGNNFYIRNIIDSIVNNYKKPEFRKRLRQITNFLNLGDHIVIQYSTATSRLFRRDGSLSKYDLIEYFEALNAKYSSNEKRPPFKLDHWNKIKTDKILIDNLCSIFDDLELDDKLYSIPNSPSKSFEYDLYYDRGASKLRKNHLELEHLRKLNLVNPPNIYFYRDNAYTLNESSSGEFHFFSTMVNLIANVEHRSLMLIDEPEISLHPNWQMKYLECIREIFSSEQISAHIIIATHSHFLVSDLKGNNSKLIGLTLDNQLEVTEFDDAINTFGWSAEEVLYRIFNVRSTRNHYFESDLVKIVTLINRNSSDYNEIGRILNKIKGIQLSDADPLKIIIEKVENYLISNNA